MSIFRTATLVALVFASGTLAVLLPRTPSPSACFVCQPYTLAHVGKMIPSSFSTSPDGDLVCTYPYGHQCTYSQTTGASTSTDTGCPTSATAVAYTCPASLSGTALTTSVIYDAFYAGDELCIYNSPTKGSGCEYNPSTGALQPNTDSDPTCPAVAPKCPYSG